jgi:hypothetical protein
MVVLDTARADALEPYGAPGGSSPVVANLASSGQALPDARVTASWTLPSHASMFTGALPRGLGLGQAPAKAPESAAPVMRAQRERSLPEMLRRAGYATAAVSTNVWVSPLSGFDVGFDRFVPIKASRQGRLHGGRRDRVRWAIEAVRGRADDGAGKAGDVLHGWIDEGVSKPFFWFVNLVECHSPYLPPRPYSGLGAAERLRAAEEARRYLNLNAIWRICTSDLEVPEDALDRMRRLYAASIRYLDKWLEELLTHLSDAGSLDDTLVIVCSDHGENFGEGGLLAHAFSLDERLIRVPFVVSGPGSDSFQGMRSLVEVPVRVARAVGADESPWNGDTHPSGNIPVAQFDPPAPASDPGVQQLVSDWGADEETLELLTTELTCAVDGRWKLQRRNMDEELFDLETDPLELSPIHHEAAMKQQAGPALDTLREALDHPSVRATAPHGVDQGSASSSEVSDIEDRMRLLGYL